MLQQAIRQSKDAKRQQEAVERGRRQREKQEAEEKARNLAEIQAARDEQVRIKEQLLAMQAQQEVEQFHSVLQQQQAVVKAEEDQLKQKEVRVPSLLFFDSTVREAVLVLTCTLCLGQETPARTTSPQTNFHQRGRADS
jgi:hypothetical protein